MNAVADGEWHDGITACMSCGMMGVGRRLHLGTEGDGHISMDARGEAGLLHHVEPRIPLV
jgi:uncharacterized UBP type Zn finger protein